MTSPLDELAISIADLSIHQNNKQSPYIIKSDTPEPVDDLSNFKEKFRDYLIKYKEVAENAKHIPNGEKTMIVLSPLSLKHAFGRDWVSKTYISTIVERPQRLLATSMGIAAAFSMFPSQYTLVSSKKKSPLNSPHVLKIHGKNWPRDLEEKCLESEAKLAAGQIEVPDDWNSGDIYLTRGTIDAISGVIGSIETAIDTILDSDINTPKRAFVAIRPPGHHSHPCAPSGFCLINNAQIAIEYSADKHDVTHAVILDIDLHHGDGSQDICWQKAGFEPDFGESAAGYETESDDDSSFKKEATEPKVGYFSLHDINSFPTELGYATAGNIKNASTCIMAHDLGIWNVHLQPYEKEEDFYNDYKERYTQVLKKADEYLSNARRSYELENAKNPNKKPFKALIVISAGFDASEYEVQTMQRHGVHVPTSFYAKFTSDAIKLAKRHSNGSILSLLEGGYSDGALSSGVFSHLVGLQELKWDQSWGSPEVVKELVKGCKPKWNYTKSPSTEIKKWTNEVCSIGRSLLPNSIISPITKNVNGTPSSETPSTGRVLRSRNSNFPPAQKMVQDDVAIPIDDVHVTPTPIPKTEPIEESTPTPTPLLNHTSHEGEIKSEHEGEFVKNFKKVDGNWKIIPKHEI
ncbi:Histone deacetylase HOS3 [Wickerhamomyces ciferrii]|uniref:Histone deacetylase HOS3 n=1 Tax=Wickerhamomyces ciferrii (strain ATCC 14091 / BCRC 22168 / CBS 111 / JCM 3599 / NBRC 0793 / NRRL Y-1031 F-60-10) TaxID=1206466 RepID=K0KFZ2_WICCF|nr:Histone deacetylase HOS3 [Wickerhamomyces ciferrii]CCH41132.1 Histone deacetylase HOS3 [Wickerhamomyces ciferrii]